MMNKPKRRLSPALTVAIAIQAGLAGAVIAAPAITTLEGNVPAATIYVNAQNNLTIVGTNSADGDTITVWVDGVQMTTVPAQVFSTGTSFTCDFNSPQIGISQNLRIRAQHGGAFLNSAIQAFWVDVTQPDVPAIHWTNPYDNPNFMGIGLNAIYANYADNGGSGIDTAATTITVSGIPGNKTANATQVNFTPLVLPFTSRFVTGTIYTIQATVYDRAGNSASNSSSFVFDGNSPNAAAIHWKDPMDLIYAGPKLDRIWALVADTGGAGINWTKSTLTVGTLAYTNTHSATEIDFNPTAGFPATPGHAFVHNTLYTVTAHIYDLADNHITNTRQFRCDIAAPTAVIQWQNPDRGNPPSYYMGQGLNRIWAVLNGTVTSTGGWNPVNYYDSMTGTAITISPAPAAGSRSVNAVTNTIEWSIVPIEDYSYQFANNTLYTVTVSISDLAGNTGSASAQFMKDENQPAITDMTIISPALSIKDDNRIFRGSAFPIGPNGFVGSITDSPNDWSGHTSLNGAGISYHAYQPSIMNVYRESTLVGSSTLFSGSGTAYQGTLTLSAHAPQSGVYSITVTARDWAHYGALTYTAHETMRVARILVDDVAPTETVVSPPAGPYYFSGGRSYMRSLNLNAYPGKVTVGARDTPADRGFNFGTRLNFANSTVTLLNPDDANRALSGGAWTQPGPVISDLCNSFTANISSSVYDAPIFPIPEYIGNTVEGRYSLVLHLEDQITGGLGSPNTRDVTYYFFNDITPPRLISWSPFSTTPLPDSFISGFSNIQVELMDPDLRDSYPGSGIDFSRCQAWMYLVLTDASHPTGVWTGSNSISSPGPFYGPQGQSLNNQPAFAFQAVNIYPPNRKTFLESSKVSGQVDSAGTLVISGLNPSTEYIVGWPVPSYYAHDGNRTIGVVPNENILKNGIYFGNFIAADNVGNTTQVESVTFTYLSAGGAIYLSVSPTTILADGVSTAIVTTSQLHLSDNPNAVVQDGTIVTVTSSLGDILTPDVDSITPGVQLRTEGGIARYTIRSRPSQEGDVVLRVRSASGSADSGDVSGLLKIVLSTLENLDVAVSPATELRPAAYTITGQVNQLLPLIAGVDKFTLDFPAGMILPANLPAGSVRLNETPISSAMLDGQRLTLLMPLTLPRGSSFSLRFQPEAGLVNPRAGHYEMMIQTTQDMHALALPYNIIITIPDDDMVPAPNPCRDGRLRFFFNLAGPAKAELLVLNLFGAKVSRVEQDYAGAKEGEVLDWDCRRVGAGVYWANLTLNYSDGTSRRLKKKKVVIVH